MQDICLISWDMGFLRKRGFNLLGGVAAICSNENNAKFCQTNAPTEVARKHACPIYANCMTVM